MPQVILPPKGPTPVLPGVSEMSTLLTAIVDRPKDVRKFLDEWNEYVKRHEEILQKWGSLQKIEKIQSDAEKALAEAEAKGVQADRVLMEYHDKISAAKTEAEAIVNRAKAAASGVMDDAKAEKTRLRDWEAALGKRNAELDVREDAIAARETECEARELNITDQEDALAAKVQKLREAGLAV